MPSPPSRTRAPFRRNGSRPSRSSTRPPMIRRRSTTARRASVTEARVSPDDRVSAVRRSRSKPPRERTGSVSASPAGIRGSDVAMENSLDPAPSLLEVRGIRKSFGAVRALQEVDFTLRAGEIHALLGENGAGKSTLIKAITGVFPRDAGIVRLGGEEVAPRSAKAAVQAGIATVYQEGNLLPNLSVAQNLFLDRQPVRFGIVREAEMRRRAKALLAEFGLDIDVAAPLGNYSVAIQHVTAIARAVDLSPRVLILDEPTASLDRHEVEILFGIMRQLAKRGIGIVFVSHFLDQVYEISDRITVLRNGRLVGERETASLSRLELIRMMLGRELAETTSARASAGGGGGGRGGGGVGGVG